jgi:hypothetical protein
MKISAKNLVVLMALFSLAACGGKSGGGGGNSVGAATPQANTPSGQSQPVLGQEDVDPSKVLKDGEAPPTELTEAQKKDPGIANADGTCSPAVLRAYHDAVEMGKQAGLADSDEVDHPAMLEIYKKVVAKFDEYTAVVKGKPDCKVTFEDGKSGVLNEHSLDEQHKAMQTMVDNLTDAIAHPEKWAAKKREPTPMDPNAPGPAIVQYIATLSDKAKSEAKACTPKFLELSAKINATSKAVQKDIDNVSEEAIRLVEGFQKDCDEIRKEDVICKKADGSIGTYQSVLEDCAFASNHLLGIVVPQEPCSAEFKSAYRDVMLKSFGVASWRSEVKEGKKDDVLKKLDEAAEGCRKTLAAFPNESCYFVDDGQRNWTSTGMVKAYCDIPRSVKVQLE